MEIRYVEEVPEIPDPRKKPGRPSLIGRLAYEALVDGKVRRIGPYKRTSAYSLASRAQKRHPEVAIKVRMVPNEGLFIFVGPKVD